MRLPVSGSPGFGLPHHGRAPRRTPKTQGSPMGAATSGWESCATRKGRHMTSLIHIELVKAQAAEARRKTRQAS